MSDKTYKWKQYTIVQDLAIRLDVFLSKIGPVDPVTGCQLQIHGSKHRQGYMMHNAHLASNYGSNKTCPGKMVTAHRIIARLKFNRPLTPDDKVYHTCGNTRCLNPDHIEIGGYKEIQDMLNKYDKRRKSSINKLTKKHKRVRDYTIPEIFWIRDATTKEIREKYKLDSHTAWEVRSRARKYKWLKDYNPDGTKK